MADMNGFDANQVEPTNFEPIPADKYVAVIIDSETKTTKAGTGSYLELTFQIQEGEYVNRQLWYRLNLKNPSEAAVKIAQENLSAICRAVEVMTPKDSSDLHDLPLVIRVTCKKRADTDEIVNEIKGFFKKESPAGANQGPDADQTPPWKRAS